jgi:hypothetical protein
MDISKYIQEIDSEILGQKEELVKKLILSSLEKFVFDEKNISSSLISLLMQKADIKIPKPDVPDLPKAVESASQEFSYMQKGVSSVFTDILVGNNVYLYGKAGTGKTTLAKKIASFLLQRETFVINCNQFTSPIDIIGGQTIEGYKQGRLCLAWQTGGVLILDELPKLDPNTAGLLNEALAESAAQDRISEISKEEYDKLKKQLEESKRELGFDVISEGKKYMRVDYPTITDGRGVKLRKNKNFACIGTGNTNMKEISQNFSGNNRQDYSLVDRFAGSFYYIDYDNALEQKLTYKKVYDISVLIRNILDSGNSVESVSLRTMLNFNRIYEQQGLRKIKSKYAIPPIMINGKPMAKTLADSLESFIDTLPDATRQNIIDNTGVMDMAIADIDDDEFIKEWHRIHGEGEENSPEPFTAKW